MVCRSVGLSVCLSVYQSLPQALQKWLNSCSNAVQDVDSGRHTEPYIRRESRSLIRRGNFEGMTVGFSHMPSRTVHSTLTSGFPHMLSTSVPTGHPQKQSSVTLNFPNEKSPRQRPAVSSWSDRDIKTYFWTSHLNFHNFSGLIHNFWTFKAWKIECWILGLFRTFSDQWQE